LNYLDELAAEIRAEVDPSFIPKKDTTSLFRIYAMLVRAKGAQVTASDVHDAWAVWALEAKPDHTAIHPFEDLDPETQAKDDPYVHALRRAAARRDPAGSPSDR
jgi:hypothetical protein